MNLVICPDCNGDKVYKTWTCQLCAGDGEVPLEVAEDEIQQWEDHAYIKSKINE